MFTRLDLPRLRFLPLIIAVLPLALAVPAVRHFVESRMSLHMLVEFPALMASGWALHLCICRVSAFAFVSRWLELGDHRGWTGATITTVVSIAWMIPSAIDASLLSDTAATLKYGSWLLAGFVLANGWRRMDSETVLFFIGNLAWMLATAGLLFIEAPAQLCVNYLENDQRHAGIGLVGLAVAIVAVALRRTWEVDPNRRTQTLRKRGGCLRCLERINKKECNDRRAIQKSPVHAGRSAHADGAGGCGCRPRARIGQIVCGG